MVRHLKTQGQPEYLEAVTAEEPTEDEDGAVFDATGMGADGGGDLFQQAVAIVKRDRKASTSYIQRRLQIGYNRAASLMERMELEGIVGPQITPASARFWSRKKTVICEAPHYSKSHFTQKRYLLLPKITIKRRPATQDDALTQHPDNRFAASIAAHGARVAGVLLVTAAIW